MMRGKEGMFDHAADRTFIIAEAGVNHDGSLKTALELVAVAADAGADAVKFQTFKAESLASRAAEKAHYQVRATGAGESQLEMIRRLELDEAAHFRLAERCAGLGIRFLSTPFDDGSLDFLDRQMGLPLLKVSSGDLSNGPFLLRLGQTGKKIILSTGMASLGEIESALSALAFGMRNPDLPVTLQSQLRDNDAADLFAEAHHSAEGRRLLSERVALLHCVTDYPAPFAAVNLRAMDTLAAAFGLPVGLSDHTLGTAIPIAAVARGAVIIEKHVTLDRTRPGPDHLASLDPEGLREMVRGIRAVEEALGDGCKLPTPSERENSAMARKSLVALTKIGKGTPFTAENLGIKRPGTGLSPMAWWAWLGRTAERDYAADEVIGPPVPPGDPEAWMR